MSEDPKIVVRKIAAAFDVPRCLLGDGCGEDDCAYCNPPKPGRWTRFTRWGQEKVRSGRRQLGEWIAGRKFDEDW